MRTYLVQLKRCMMLLLLLAGTQTVFSQNEEQRILDLKRDIKSIEYTKPYQRIRWWYDQRAYPNDKMEQGYLLKAFRQEQQTRARKTASPNSLFTWTEIGPITGQVSNYGNIAGRFVGVAINPTNSNIIYAAAADGGVWKTTNAGVSWIPTTDFQPSLASGGVAIDPSNPNNLYYGTGESYPSIDAYGGVGVMKSTDEGASWFSSGLSNELRIPKVEVNPFSSSNVIAATFGGVYLSTDAGGNWTKVLNLASAYDVNYDRTNSQIVYAGIGENSGNAGVWKSTDG